MFIVTISNCVYRNYNLFTNRLLHNDLKIEIQYTYTILFTKLITI